MTRRHSAITPLCLLFAASASLVAGHASAAPVTLPPGYTLEKAAADAATAPPAFSAPATAALPDHPGWPVSVVGGASPPVCADLDPSYPGLHAWPNPFSGSGAIRIVHTGDRGPCTINVLDAAGRIVRTLSRTETPSGEIRWDGRNTAGQQVRPGVYFLRERAPATRAAGRLILLH